MLLAGTPAPAQSQPRGVGGLFSGADPALRGDSFPDAGIIRVPGITTLRSRAVDIDFGQLAEARVAVARAAAPTGSVDAVDLTLNLFDDVVLPAVVERSTATASGSGYVVSGRLDGVDQGTWRLFVYDGPVTGTVRTPTATFRIRTVDGVHVISQIDTSALPRFEDRAVPPPPDARPDPTPSGSDAGLPDAIGRTTDPGDKAIVDVAVAYTPAAVEGAGELEGDAGIDGLIHKMIHNTHEAYERSGALLRLRLVWSGQHDCSGSTCSDGSEALKYLPSLGRLRRAYGADLLSWIVDIPEFGGEAYRPGHYSVVNYNQERDHYTFAHELGHNMYLNHDRWAVVNVPEGGGDLDDPYPYSHGHISRNCEWRTIMAYPDRCLDDRVTRVPAIRNFSNPNRIHEDGERMGVFGDSPSSEVDGPADAVRSLNAKRRQVAAYWDPTSDREAVFTFVSTIRAAGRIISDTAFLRNKVRWDAQGRATAVYLGGQRSSGELPDYLATLKELVTLSLSANFFTGIVPARLGKLTRLVSLDLGDNELTGSIPPMLGNLTRLTTLRLTGNQLTGPIPPELGKLTNLVDLRLWRNGLTGPIPPELGRLTNLQHLGLEDNGLTGPIPAQLGKLTNLTYVGLARNQLTGPIPPELGNLTKARFLWLQDNQLTGPIPAELGRLTTLSGLWLNDNQLTGPIPAELARMSRLRGLFIDRDTGLCLAQDFPLDSYFARLARSQGVSVCGAGTFTFTDDPLVAGATAVKAVHFTELRVRVDDLRVAHGLGRFPWTDPTLIAGVTPVAAVHVSQLRAALVQAYEAAGATPPGFGAEPMQTGRSIRAAHVNELRRAVEALEQQ